VPLPTPFHARTAALSRGLLYKDWSGYLAVRSFETCHEREYHAFRQSAGLLDVTPLFKYDVRGPDAARLLSRVMVRAAEPQKVGLVRYLCWCDDAGKVLDDGTVTRLDDEHFRVTSADPSLRWLERHARGLDVAVRDVSREIAALALQGPCARDVLGAAGIAVDGLRFFRATTVTAPGGGELLVTRTGYTGDLGYELWVANDGALALWDALVEAGRPYGLLPAGLDALDVVRVEAGFLLSGVDYTSARFARIPSQLSSPDELGFGWMVELDRDPFVGQAALRRERDTRATARRLVGLEVDWDALEALYDAHGLPPELPAGTSRDAVPVYQRGTGRFVGQATSRAWSPACKAYLALATVEADFAPEGSEVDLELTVEYRREPCRAVVRARPFFDPERKKA
jgi:aminomethyltransferase